MVLELGEVRTAMAKNLMKYLEGIIEKHQNKDKYYVLVHAKPFPNHPHVIKQKFLIMDEEPPMMLACMAFEVDNKEGKLTLLWSLPLDCPTWHREGSKPIPEVIANYDKLNKRLSYGPRAA
jgi:hypothetical protein